MLLDDNRLNAALNAVTNNAALRSQVIRSSPEEILTLLQAPGLIGAGQQLTPDERAYCVGQAVLLKAQFGSDDADWVQALQNFVNGGPGG